MRLRALPISLGTPRRTLHGLFKVGAAVGPRIAVMFRPAWRRAAIPPQRGGTAAGVPSTPRRRVACAMLDQRIMEHGKHSHDQRSAHVRRPRHNNTPPVETRPIATGGHGAEHAPTARAAERERRRHKEEQKHGHYAAGVGGRMKAEDRKVEQEESPMEGRKVGHTPGSAEGER